MLASADGTHLLRVGIQGRPPRRGRSCCWSRRSCFGGFRLGSSFRLSRGQYKRWFRGQHKHWRHWRPVLLSKDTASVRRQHLLGNPQPLRCGGRRRLHTVHIRSGERIPLPLPSEDQWHAQRRRCRGIASSVGIGKAVGCGQLRLAVAPSCAVGKAGWKSGLVSCRRVARGAGRNTAQPGRAQHGAGSRWAARGGARTLLRRACAHPPGRETDCSIAGHRPAAAVVPGS